MRAGGLQAPALVRGYGAPAAHLQPLLGPDMKDLGPLSRALGEDREVRVCGSVGAWERACVRECAGVCGSVRVLPTTTTKLQIAHRCTVYGIPETRAHTQFEY